jgi:tetratricopeptide (TPR) repeat protein
VNTFRISLKIGLSLSLLLTSCSDFRARLLFWEASEAGARKEWEEALFTFQRIWVEYPQSKHADQARWMALQIYAGPLSQPGSARYLAQDLLLNGSDPGLRLKALMKFLELLRWENREKEAIPVLKGLLPTFPPSTELRSQTALELACIYILSLNFSEAVLLLEKESPSSTRKEEWSLYLGQAYEGLREFPKAESYYLEVLKTQKPGSRLGILAAQGLVRIYEEGGKPARALKILELYKDSFPNRTAHLSWSHRLEERLGQGVTAP